MKLLHNERGMSVIWAALVLSLLGIYAAVGNTLIAERSESLGGIQQSEQSLYLAESGLKMAVETLENNWGTWDDANAFPTQNLGGGTFDATVGNEGLIVASQNYYPLGEAPDYGSDTEDDTSTATADTSSTGSDTSTTSGDGGTIGDSSQIYKIVHAVADGSANATVSVVKSQSITQSNDNDEESSSSTTQSISSSTTSSATVTGTYPDPDNSKKVLICHYPPGNSSNAHTVSVSKNALSSHYDHHTDTDGPCVATVDPNKIDVVVQGNKGGSSRYIKATISKYMAALHNAVYTTAMLYIQGLIPVVDSGDPIKTYYAPSTSTLPLDPFAFQASSVTGYATQYAENFPTLNVAEAKELAKGNNENGMLIISSGNYFQGSSLMPMLSLNGVIFFDVGTDGSAASVSLSNLSTTSTEPALLIVRGNLFLSNVNFNGLIVVLEGSTVTLDQSTVTGAVVANQAVNLTGGTKVTYNSYNVFSDNLEIALTNIMKPTVLAWKEYFPQ